MKLSVFSAERVLATLAAASLVGAFALASLMPPLLSLGQFLLSIDQAWIAALHGFVARFLSEWAWRELFLPLLRRPAWLLPTSLGLIFIGAALTAASRRSAKHAPRLRD